MKIHNTADSIYVTHFSPLLVWTTQVNADT